MNSHHAKILLKLMQFLEAFDEVPSVSCSFNDSVGRERLWVKINLEFEIDAKNPKKETGEAE